MARNIVKMMTPTEKTIGRNIFYIYPLPAFTAARLSTEVICLLSPLVGGMANAFKNSRDDSSESDGAEKKNLMDMDVSEAAPYIANAFSSLPSDKVERLIRELLLDGCVAVREDDSMDAEYLTEDKCNEVFCGNIQNMFVLAFYVLKENYGDFFGSIGIQSGNLTEAVKKMGFPVMDPLT